MLVAERLAEARCDVIAYVCVVVGPLLPAVAAAKQAFVVPAVCAPGAALKRRCWCAAKGRLPPRERRATMFHLCPFYRGASMLPEFMGFLNF